MGIFLTIDIGGTHIRAATYHSESTTPLAHKKITTRSPQGAIFDRLVGLAESIWPKDGSVTAIGMASPGPLDPKSGTILDTPNIREWRNFPVGPKLAERFGVPVFLDNDANLAALGEWRYGAGRGHEHVLYLTISTGIGGGVISHNRLLQGHHGLAAELGHATILAGGPVCSCGYPGHLEALASGPAIVRYVEEQLAAGAESSLKSRGGLNAVIVAEAAREGDPLSIRAYARAGEYLGIGVASFLHIFDPSIIIFGGGVSQSGPLLFDSFETSLKKHVFNPKYLEDLQITTAALGDDAGLLGALALAHLSMSA
jgi:glucokinase